MPTLCSVIQVALLNASLLGLAMMSCNSSLRAAEGGDKDPIGPVELQLNDGSKVGGVLLDFTDTDYTVHTDKGVQRYLRTKVLKVTTVSADPPRPNTARAADDDVDDAPAIKRKSAPPKPVVAGDPERNLLERLKKTPANDMPPAPTTDTKAIPPSSPKPFTRTVYHTDKTLPRYVQLALEKLENGAYAGAAEDMRNLVSNGTEEELAAGESVIQERFKKPLRNIMVLCYMQTQCGPCKATGMISCERCGGSGYVVVMQTPSTTLDPRKKGEAAPIGFHGIDGTRYRHVDVCGICKGNGYDVCQQCMGTRLGVYRPTMYEREAYANEFLRLAADTLASGEENFGDTGREPPPASLFNNVVQKSTLEQVYLTDSGNRVKSDIMRMWRAEGYYTLAIKADPLLILRTDRWDPLESTCRHASLSIL